MEKTKSKQEKKIRKGKERNNEGDGHNIGAGIDPDSSQKPHEVFCF